MGVCSFLYNGLDLIILNHKCSLLKHAELQREFLFEQASVVKMIGKSVWLCITKTIVLLRFLEIFVPKGVLIRYLEGGRKQSVKISADLGDASDVTICRTT